MIELRPPAMVRTHGRLEVSAGLEVMGNSDRSINLSQQRRARAVADLIEGIARWRLWFRLGWNDIAQRYRRSVLGPFWLTASMAIMVATLGVVYAELFNQPMEQFLPFFCVGLLVWNLIASYLIEGGSLFTGSESYIKQIRLPFSLYVYRASWAKLIIFFHNFVIYIGVLIFFRIWPGMVSLLAIPGLVLVVLNGTIANLTIGIVSARFRDIPQVINSVVQILLFLTPIFWMPSSLKGHAYITDFNPFYHLVEVVRAPLLGSAPTSANYLAVLLLTLFNVAIAGLFFTRFRSRIAYWI
jgi:lipopolysaccharide transport system permease protein